MPALTTTAVTAATVYLSGKMAGGFMQEVGKDLWHKIKSCFTSDKEKALPEQLEQDPGNQRLQGRIEGLLESKLENDETLRKALSDLIDQIDNETRTTIHQIIHSPGAVTGNHIQAGGDVILGNSKKES